MQKLFATLGGAVITGTVVLLALIIGAIAVASVCSAAADIAPDPEPPALPTARPLPSATAQPQPELAADPAPPPHGPVPGIASAIPPATDFSGAWLVREYVIEGPGTGQLTTYEVRLVQSGATLTGSGGGFELRGRVNDATAELEYTQSPGGRTGSFTWTLVRDGTASGVFTSSAPAKGLISMQRLP